MACQVFEFGSLLFEGQLFDVDQIPAVVTSPAFQSFDFGDTPNSPSQTLTWLQPDGCKFLIADHVLLTGLSWVRLHGLGYDGGKKVTIDGDTYFCRLMTRKEWKSALKGVDNPTQDLHLFETLSWTKNTEVDSKSDDITAFACGAVSEVRIPIQTATGVGFRPILVPEKKNSELYRSQSVIVLDNQAFSVEFPASIEHASSRAEFRPNLVPMRESTGDGGYAPDPGVFSALELGQSVRMYTLTMDGKPIPIQEGVPYPYASNASLEFSDSYFGEEYLIQWTIRDGKAVASWPILRDISRDEVMEQAFFQEEQARLW
jgi:hypothetical protein